MEEKNKLRRPQIKRDKGRKMDILHFMVQTAFNSITSIVVRIEMKKVISDSVIEVRDFIFLCDRVSNKLTDYLMRDSWTPVRSTGFLVHRAEGLSPKPIRFATRVLFGPIDRPTFERRDLFSLQQM
ncbi:unnamed protein product [Spodoptera exigua]|nr:unnamed protein product [Spodoptera exigua]